MSFEPTWTELDYERVMSDPRTLFSQYDLYSMFPGMSAGKKKILGEVLENYGVHSATVRDVDALVNQLGALILGDTAELTSVMERGGDILEYVQWRRDDLIARNYPIDVAMKLVSRMYDNQFQYFYGDQFIGIRFEDVIDMLLKEEEEMEGEKQLNPDRYRHLAASESLLDWDTCISDPNLFPERELDMLLYSQRLDHDRFLTLAEKQEHFRDNGMLYSVLNKVKLFEARNELDPLL